YASAPRSVVRAERVYMRQPLVPWCARSAYICVSPSFRGARGARIYASAPRSVVRAKRVYMRQPLVPWCARSAYICVSPS
ncbi:MAG: hypothetical protein K2M63_02300, partial [Muribaculaceae bacterium]|nr:hypothetical protein [Muribaculaceae bacterium]